MYLELQCHGDFLPFRKILQTIAGADRESFIDLCCYDGAQTKGLNFSKKTFVDALQPPSIPTEGRFIETNVLGEHPVFSERFDVSFCLDGIEHLHKEQGYELLRRMESISKKQILFTPLGAYMVTPDDPHPHSHKSGWLPEDVRDYAIIACPNWHPTLGVGAFFFFKCPNLASEFERVKAELMKDAYYMVQP